MSDLDIFDEFETDDASDVSLDPGNKAPSNKVDRFKGEQGATYRVGLMYFHPLAQSLYQAAKSKAKKEGTQVDKAAVKAAYDKALAKRAEEYGKAVDELAEWEKLNTNKAQFKKYNSQYKEGTQGIGVVQSRLGLDGPEADKVWSMLGEARTHYSTALIIYATDRDGNVEKDMLLSRTRVQPWRFGPGTFNRLIEIDQKLRGLPGGQAHLAVMDLKLKCKNAQWQNFEVDFDSESIWQKSAKMRQKFLPIAHGLYDKIVDAREMSTADLRIKLGLSSGSTGGTTSDVSDDDMGDLLDNV